MKERRRRRAVHSGRKRTIGQSRQSRRDGISRKNRPGNWSR
jgi:hypothetical protein